MRSGATCNGTCPATHVHADLAKGRNWMMVRPELVRLYLGIRRFDCQLEGEIVERFHRGPMLQLRIKAPGLDQPLIVDVPTRHRRRSISGVASPGLERADTYLLPREDQAMIDRRYGKTTAAKLLLALGLGPLVGLRSS